MREKTDTIPPQNARWIISNRDLPQQYQPAQFKVTKQDGRAFDLVVSKRKRQVLEALMKGPLYCASPIRLSDNVLLLRNEYDVAIATDFYTDDSGPISTHFGIYTLTDCVRFLGEVAPKAEEAA